MENSTAIELMKKNMAFNEVNTNAMSKVKSSRTTKQIQLGVLSMGLFLLGQYLFWLGFAKGRAIGIAMQRPAGASSWISYPELGQALTWTLAWAGGSLTLLSIAFLTIVAISWLRD